VNQANERKNETFVTCCPRHFMHIVSSEIWLKRIYSKKKIEVRSSYSDNNLRGDGIK
jgi:hypothetical protein